jgi:hypothetical protein
MADREYPAAGGESNRPFHSILKKTMGRGESRVAAKIDLSRRRKPTKSEVSVGQFFFPNDEPRIGHVRLPRDRSRPLIRRDIIKQQHRRRVPSERPIGE